LVDSSKKLELHIERTFYDILRMESKDSRVKMIEEIHTLITTYDKFKKLISKRDLTKSYISLAKQNAEHQLSHEEVAAFIRVNLLTTFRYHFYFSFMGSDNYPEDWQIGYCKPINFDHLPEAIRIELAKSYNNMDMSKSLFLHLFLDANGVHKAEEIALERCEASIDLLIIHSHNVYKIDRFEVFIEENGEYIFDRRRSDGYENRYSFDASVDLEEPKINRKRYDSTIEFEVEEGETWYADEKIIEEYKIHTADWFGDISMIACEEWQESAKHLGRKLKTGLHLHALAICQENKEIRLMLLCSALEAMLLTDSDKDLISSKLAERVAFLLPYNDRLNIHNYLKTLYNKRSRFIHQGDKKDPVTWEDCDTLDSMVSGIFMELQVLLFTGWETLQGRNDPSTSVIDYIDDLKFGGNRNGS
jgi:hypothetical protein